MEKADDKVKEAAKHKGDYANGADKAPCAHIVIDLALFLPRGRAINTNTVKTETPYYEAARAAEAGEL